MLDTVIWICLSLNILLKFAKFIKTRPGAENDSNMNFKNIRRIELSTDSKSSSTSNSQHTSNTNSTVTNSTEVLFFFACFFF